MKKRQYVLLVAVCAVAFLAAFFIFGGLNKMSPSSENFVEINDATISGIVQNLAKASLSSDTEKMAKYTDELASYTASVTGIAKNSTCATVKYVYEGKEYGTKVCK